MLGYCYLPDAILPANIYSLSAVPYPMPLALDAAGSACVVASGNLADPLRPSTQ